MAQEPKLDSLEERLRSHAESFNGLLSLIPAKYYYGEDTSDQWQKKKQTKEQHRAAKLAKLDPDNAKSAKDVLDEQAANARKRKREEETEDVDSEAESANTEKPIPIAAKKGKQTKKQKREEKGDTSRLAKAKKGKGTETNKIKQNEENLREAKAEKNRERKQRKKAKAEKAAAKAEAKRARKNQEVVLEEDSKAVDGARGDDEEEDDRAANVDIDPIEIDKDFGKSEAPSSSTASPSPTTQSPAFGNSNTHSGSSSISSIAPPPAYEEAQVEETTKHDQAKQNSTPKKADPEELKARLQQRIDNLRAARKADGLDGAPVRNRQELMEARRRKEEQRKAHKKEVRQKAKEEEQRKRSETLTRGSPLFSPGSPLTPSSEPNNFSFGRIAFPSGHTASASLSTILDPSSKTKGPSDPRTALVAAENKLARLSALDKSKRADIAEKDTWLHAKKRAHGERIRDDTSLLKKTLKRKEKAKKKSEKEWGARIEGVQKGQALRQKKREANLQKRRDDKGGSGKSKGAAKKMKTNPSKPKARPGFEGSFRAKAPKSVGGGEGGRRR